MKPHKDQQGYKYIRIKSCGKDKEGREIILKKGDGHVFYDDTLDFSRTISSERVERAVETDDYLRRCEEEGLDACSWRKGWLVADSWVTGEGPTLREAYGDYRAKRAKREREQ